MNVYVAEVAKQLAARGVEVDIFTRATTGALPPIAQMVPGVSVRHVTAGPYEGLGKDDLPGQLCAFAAGVMRAAAARPEGWYDVLHTHYWLSGQVGWLAADRWGVPLVHTMHTMARVKNLYLPTDDSPEPPGREIGEAQVVEAADRLVANTDGEAAELIELYDADPDKVRVVPPGVDLATFTPGDENAARRRARPARDRQGAAVRRPDPAAQGARRAAPRGRRAARAGTPTGATTSSLAVLGGPSGSGLDAVGRAGGAGRPARRRGRDAVRAAGLPPRARRSGTAPPTSSSCRRTASRSGWSRSRRRRAGPRSSPPTSAGCPSPSATPACSSRATTSGLDDRGRVAARSTRRVVATSDGEQRCTPRVSAGRRRPTTCSRSTPRLAAPATHPHGPLRRRGPGAGGSDPMSHPTKLSASLRYFAGTPT